MNPPVPRTGWLVAVFLGVLLSAVAAVGWFRSSTDPLNREQYAIAIALYRACNQQDDHAIDRLELRYQQIVVDPVTPSRQIEAVIRRAREKNWDAATRAAHRLIRSQSRR